MSKREAENIDNIHKVQFKLQFFYFYSATNETKVPILTIRRTQSLAYD